MKNNHKSLLTVLLFLFFLVGCASVKNKYTPAGTWNYLVKDTPMGDSQGVLEIVQTDTGYEGKMITDNFGEGKLENLSIVENQLTATVYLAGAGVSVDIKGLFEGETFTGAVGVNGDEYILTGNRTPAL